MNNFEKEPIRSKCPDCGEILRRFRPRLIPTNNPTPYWPKYNLQIKEVCAICDRYIRFAPQTSELIRELNRIFSEEDLEINEDA